MWEKDGSFWFVVSGDLRDEIHFHKEVIFTLLSKLFKIRPRIREVPSHSEVRTIIKSKAIVEFKHEFLGLPMGEKSTTVSIPSKIKKSDFTFECLRGIFDTDAHLTMSKEMTILSVMTASEKLFTDITGILKRSSFDFWCQRERGVIRLSKTSALRFLDEITLHSIKHMSKFRIWKEFGFCPIRTSTEERLAVLEDRIPFEELVRISGERKTTS